MSDYVPINRAQWVEWYLADILNRMGQKQIEVDFRVLLHQLMNDPKLGSHAFIFSNSYRGFYTDPVDEESKRHLERAFETFLENYDVGEDPLVFPVEDTSPLLLFWLGSIGYMMDSWEEDQTALATRQFMTVLCVVERALEYQQSLEDSLLTLDVLIVRTRLPRSNMDLTMMSMAVLLQSPAAFRYLRTVLEKMDPVTSPAQAMPIQIGFERPRPRYLH